jgi:hypothetical protein
MRAQDQASQEPSVPRKLSGEAARREARRIDEVSLWPTWPLLHVQRNHDGSHEPELGVICSRDVEHQVQAGAERRLRVFVASAGRLETQDLVGIAEGASPSLEVIARYADVGALIDAGWATR